MDFRQTVQPNSGRPSAAGTPAAAASAPEEGKKTNGAAATDVSINRWTKIFSFVVLVGTAILLALVALGLGRGPTNTEAKLVQSDKYQAVFLNSGQVYFGHVDSLNSQYVRMSDIFYLTNSSGTTGDSNYSLVKLGCQQIHDPLDSMVINRAQVSFWENIKDDGKVVQSISKFQKTYPNGPDCSKVSTQTQATNDAAAQDAAGNDDTTK
jgi:hypothetical protein